MDDEICRFKIVGYQSPVRMYLTHYQLNGDLLAKAVEQLWRYRIRAGAEVDALPVTGGVLSALVALAQEKDQEKEDMRERARRISQQYVEDRERLDLDMAVLRARQRQALQRKLLQRTARPAAGYGQVAAVIPSADGKPNSSAGKGGGAKTSMAARGMNLNPMFMMGGGRK